MFSNSHEKNVSATVGKYKYLEKKMIEYQKYIELYNLSEVYDESLVDPKADNFGIIAGYQSGLNKDIS